MAYWQEYLTPRTVDEAVRLLAGYGDDAQIVAGGADLILGFQQSGHQPVKALVDVTAIDGLSQIGEDDTHVVIGAAVTHTQIECHPLVLRHGAALAEGREGDSHQAALRPTLARSTLYVARPTPTVRAGSNMVRSDDGQLP